MRKYVFIKDEAYSSNLYTNFTEYLAKDDDLECSFGGSEKYKIKLMTTESARGLIGNHPLMLSANVVNAAEDNKIALVSFGGCIYELNIDQLIKEADITGSSTLASFSSGTDEAEMLSKARTYSSEDIKEKKGMGFIYLTLVKLENTNLYYMILNPTLVHCTGQIEIEGDPWIEQIKGIKDTLRDSIFTMSVTPKALGSNIISGGLCVIDLFEDSVIQPEDRVELYNQLDIEIETKKSKTEILTETAEGHHIAVAHTGDTYLTLEVKNKLLGDYISDKEKLKWEYIILSLKD